MTAPGPLGYAIAELVACPTCEGSLSVGECDRYFAAARGLASQRASIYSNVIGVRHA